MLKDFSIYAESSTILALCHGSGGQYIWATLPVPVGDDAWGSPLNEASSQAQRFSAIHASETREPAVVLSRQPALDIDPFLLADTPPAHPAMCVEPRETYFAAYKGLDVPLYHLRFQISDARGKGGLQQISMMR
ncbi:hypothetical protein Vi05172_g9903 [Venturia inaequalis]|nr:hypothetical protein Vi05172_g9903 [Venturia inaequalis]